MGDVKNFLYAWCGKRKVTPTYEIRAVGNKNRQKFMCEVRPWARRAGRGRGRLIAASARSRRHVRGAAAGVARLRTPGRQPQARGVTARSGAGPGLGCSCANGS